MSPALWLRSIKKLQPFCCLYFQVKLVNIRNDDITDGNPKLTLGLIWTIILHFQVGHGIFLLEDLGQALGKRCHLSRDVESVIPAFSMDGSGGSWQCHGDHVGRTAAPSPRHLYNEIINDGLCAALSQGCWPWLFAQLESPEEKSKFGRGHRLLSQPFGWSVQPQKFSLGWNVSAG